MNHLTVRRTSVALATVAALLVTLAAPASAGSSGHYRSSGRTASVDWIEYDEDTDPVDLPGNVHVGSLFIEQSSRTYTDIWGYIEDYECEEGETPYGGGHGDVAVAEEEPPEGGCDFVGERYVWNEDAVFTMDRKLTSARLVGRLFVKGGHGSEDVPAATPSVDIVWTAIGDPYTAKYRESYSDGTSTYTYTYTFSGTDAAVSGRMGPMNFTDDENDESYGFMGEYRNMERFRSR